jgi:hypothetical protein
MAWLGWPAALLVPVLSLVLINAVRVCRCITRSSDKRSGVAAFVDVVARNNWTLHHFRETAPGSVNA